MGNTCLYGATGGELYAAGTRRRTIRGAQFRRARRGGGHGRSLLRIHDRRRGLRARHAPGVNFGAGFTGGFAYVLDMERDFVDRYNHELIDIHRVSPEGMGIHVQHLRGLIEQHVEATDSVWGAQLLNDFRSYIGRFWVVKPKAAAIDSLLENLRRAA